MRKWNVLASVAACSALTLAVVFMPGCKSKQDSASAMTSPGAVALCTGCGQVKGSDACCAPGAATCSMCGLAKGSPGCCVITKGSNEPVALCATCGQIKGSDACCDPDAMTCSKCGLAMGSPGCCKIK